uniref:Orf173 n=1 Tax=Spizellomyces punctatus TaxID=109760 RepID=Q950S8_SPIPN|nr:orf173 [Spizellomyces punctatus]AAK84230.1 orf173 [Spizellomyces punctatus]
MLALVVLILLWPSIFIWKVNLYIALVVLTLLLLFLVSVHLLSALTLLVANYPLADDSGTALPKLLGGIISFYLANPANSTLPVFSPDQFSILCARLTSLLPTQYSGRAGKTIYIFDLNKTLVATYSSFEAAANALGLATSSISQGYYHNSIVAGRFTHLGESIRYRIDLPHPG